MKVEGCRHAEHGIALIITLILLSVTLVMAVAFLAISRRERGSVATSTDTTTARLAADAGLANAEGQIIASVFATTNANTYGLLVSTNFINRNGFDPGLGVYNPTNVNYDYLVAGGKLNQAQFLQNVANLYYLPRVPVFIVTNQQTGASDFRYYLDLDRNGQFEDTGLVDETNRFGLFTGNQVSEIGDPQWVGILERPDAPHGPNNKFIARYAFIALPADNTLDLNAIHNQSYTAALTPANDGYFRDQGVGSWEINLAAFLTDLNTNEWDTLAAGYNYLRPASPNTGFAFQDALSLLSYRYNFDYFTLQPASALLAAAVLRGAVDLSLFPLYPPLPGLPMTTPATPDYNTDLTRRWAGADNTNHYFALTSDLFDPNKVENSKYVTPPGFIERLSQADNGVSTYDRYTFYRMLNQLGTDSSPEADKINLNYSNAAAFYDVNGLLTNIVVYPNAQTNLVPWQPLQFFTIAADRMLRLYTTEWFQSNPSNYLATHYGITGYNYYHSYYDSVGNYVTVTNDPSGLGLTNVPFFGMTNQIPSFGITNIPVFVNGRYVYSSAVQRVLQLAANMYDATTNTFYPSVFRPMFYLNNTVYSPSNLFVIGYTNLIGPGGFGTVFSPNTDNQFSTPFDPATIASLNPAPPGLYLPRVDNIYGVPWIIGAKKGFPNFNEFSTENSVQVTRKLQFNRDMKTVPPSNYTTNQMYLMTITNYFGAECWNSYFNRSNYLGPTGLSGPILIWGQCESSMSLTNYSPYATPTALLLPNVATNYISYTLNSWGSNQFVVPLNTNSFMFNTTNAAFVYRYNNFYNISNFMDFGIAPLPQFGLVVTNRLQLAIVDYSAGGGIGHVVDYVQLGPLAGSRDINREIADPTTTGLWSTNLVGTPGSTVPQGVINQYYTSRDGHVPAEDIGEGKWSNAQVPGLPPGISSSPQAEQIYFTAFFSSRSTANYGGLYTVSNLLSSMQAPYTPIRTRVQRLTWQANDPLVHYVGSDLVDLADDTNAQHVVDWPANLGLLNNRYQPWGGNPLHPPNPNTPDDPRTASADTMMLKDPRVSSSQYWDFPTNKLPTVGWLGRVHRGTPWQTVYLKASNILKAQNGINIWQYWTGNFDIGDAIDTGPVQDRLLFDLFSTAPNENATRGRLSVNVAANSRDPGAGLAAWSAVMSGLAVPTNLNGGYAIIPPAGSAGVVGSLNSPLGPVVTNINFQRTFFTNATSVGGAFKHVGDILSVRAFSEQSPWLTPFFNSPLTNGFNDEMYEWLPQQTLSLLRAGTENGGPRYVIYSYGQTLKPAPNGIVTSGADFGMVTNYQVVAESATRAVVQWHSVLFTNSLGAVSTNYNATVEQFNPLPPD